MVYNRLCQDGTTHEKEFDHAHSSLPLRCPRVCPAPVSYTHLDVYKRQGQAWRTKALLAAFGDTLGNLLAEAGGDRLAVDQLLSLIHICLGHRPFTAVTGVRVP